MNLTDIKFPVYKLREKPEVVDGISFFIVADENGLATRVLDDKNLEGATLAMRRLQLKAKGVSLYKLDKAVFFISDFIKLTKGTTWYIDSQGRIFDYRKKTKVPLVFRPIAKVIPIMTGGAIIEIKGIAARFKILFAPTYEYKYAGLLKYRAGYILYGVYKEKLKDTTRTI